jgi:hypothetical protein
VVKRCVGLIGLDPKVYGGHSLRAGMVTAALDTSGQPHGDHAPDRTQDCADGRALRSPERLLARSSDERDVRDGLLPVAFFFEGLQPRVEYSLDA